MTNDEILQAAKEAGYGTEFYLNDDKPAHEEIWGGPMETQKVRNLTKIIEKRTIERCAVVAEYALVPSFHQDEANCIGLKHRPTRAACAAAIRKLGEKE